MKSHTNASLWHRLTAWRGYALATLAALSGMLATHAWAATAECASAATQAAMNVCADEDFLVANGEYAQQYRSLSQQLPKAQHDQLRRTQTAWLNFRTAACRFESGAAAGGSVQHYVYWTCAARMTRERSAELARIGTCREGDITCTAKKP